MTNPFMQQKQHQSCALWKIKVKKVYGYLLPGSINKNIVVQERPNA